MTEDLLEQIDAAKAAMLPLSHLKTHEAFQPRVDRIVPLRDRGQVMRGSEEHIDSLSMKLCQSREMQLDPIRVARIAADDPSVPTGCYVVDGHHRVQAYTRAHRKEIPARIQSMSFQEAILVSKVANCSHRSMKMHDEQRRDAAWQYLAIITQRGQLPLPKGESYRSMAARFIISKNTVQTMLKRLTDVDPNDFIELAVTAGTGWPRWQWVRESRSYQQQLFNCSPDEKAEREARILLSKVVTLFGKTTLATRERFKQIAAEEKALSSSQSDALDDLMDLVELFSRVSP